MKCFDPVIQFADDREETDRFSHKLEHFCISALCTKSGINYIGSWTDADGEISTLHCCLDSPLLSAEDTYIMYTIPIFT